MSAFGVPAEMFDPWRIPEGARGNILPWLQDDLKKANAVAQITIGANGFVDKDKYTRPVQAATPAPVANDKPVKALKVLKEKIISQQNGEPFLNDAGKFTEVGRAWAKRPGGLAAICEKHSIEKDLDRMSHGSILIILRELGYADDAKALDEGNTVGEF